MDQAVFNFRTIEGIIGFNGMDNWANFHKIGPSASDDVELYDIYTQNK